MSSPVPMSLAVIVSAARTPIGTARKGSLANTLPETLAAVALRGAVERSSFDPSRIDDVIFAESLAGGGAIARHAAVEIGLTGAGGAAINRHCAGGLTALGFAAASIMTGMEHIVVAGGVNSSSFFPRMMQRDPATGEFSDWWMPGTHPNTPDAPNNDMSITVGWNAAKTLGLTRKDMDAWALRSHQRALTGNGDGRFKAEIVPVNVRGADGQEFSFAIDEHPRLGGSLEKLAALPVIHPEIEGFSITPGNSSGINDAAAALVLTSAALAKAESKDILATVLGWTSLGVEPAQTGLSVPQVVEKLLARTGHTLADITLWEINEAFAAVPLAACRVLKLDEETVNISGSGCSLGHPIGASGARMVMTLANDLRGRGGGLGIAAMCAGGGQAGVVLIEV